MQARIEEAAAILRSGGLVAMPTETVYGLAANALDPRAVEKIFAAKQRPAWDPVIVHIANEAMLAELTSSLPGVVHPLVKNFWPGPLTLLLPKSERIPGIVTAGRPLVGVRIPDDPVALALIQAAAVPLAAPSANRFGHTSPTLAQHVLDDLDGRIDCILDAGPCHHGLESTVLDPNRNPMLIYRPGAVTREQILAAAGREVEHYSEPAQLTAQPPEALPSPGVGLRHYAPAARLILFESSLDEMPEAFAKIIEVERNRRHGAKTGLLVPKEVLPQLPRAGNDLTHHEWGRWGDASELAANLYTALRALDDAGCQIIIAPVPPAVGIGEALRDRMRKAASAAPVTR